MAEVITNDRILEEVKMLKQTLTPVMSLMQDFRDLKVRNRLSPDSNVSVLNLLTANIKDDIMKEVFHLNNSVKKSISDVEHTFGYEIKEIIGKFEVFQTSLQNFDGLTTQMNESITSIKGHLNNFYDKLDVFRAELDEKATIDEMNDIRQKCKHFALRQDLDELKIEVFDKASGVQVEKLERRVTFLDTRMDNYIDKKDIDDIQTTLRLQSEAYIDLNCMLREDFLKFKDSFVSARTKSEEEFKNLVHKVDTANKNLKDSINELTIKLGKNPWKRDIEKLEYLISLCAKNAHLKTHEEIVFPLLDKFTVQVNESINKISLFESIIQRYDEILLEKAAKDDIRYIKNQLYNYISTDDFKEEISRLDQRFAWTQSEIETLHSSIKTFDNTALTLSSKCESLKKEHKDITGISTLIDEIKAMIQEKADKIDFHNLIDITSTKEDFDKLITRVDIVQKQVELGSILNQTLCRTLICTGEQSSSIIKQRQDVFRKMGGLVGWIKGDEIRVKSAVPWRATPTVKTEHFIYKEDSLKTLNRTTCNTRNNTARIKVRPKRYTPKPESASMDLVKDQGVFDGLNIRIL
ncbi:hypothetical protein SteCoe_12789 [Stentor coeruleus]|uniref:Uncharacterized protein n=1 Tax=Stentor coeruleus TaxID=5963 RepID=A0A1R2C9X0_9CILI|nr:hypothetical protein SteCoe_12789 [Stentor coeruleus]